ncbi:MAG: hypothetical protein WDK95_10845, partial [Syntrophorhabdaceae bacterium]
GILLLRRLAASADRLGAENRRKGVWEMWRKESTKKHIDNQLDNSTTRHLDISTFIPRYSPNS